jgi:hypothetical protein
MLARGATLLAVLADGRSERCNGRDPVETHRPDGSALSSVRSFRRSLTITGSLGSLARTY